jgi:hypothetical protein
MKDSILAFACFILCWPVFFGFWHLVFGLLPLGKPQVYRKKQ